MATDNTKKPATDQQAPGNPPVNIDGYSKQNPPKSVNTPTEVYNGVPPIYTPATPGFTPKDYVPVGGVILASEPIEYNTNRYTVRLKVRNTGDRPVQIGSHFHFFEVNRYMEFDRKKSFGYHLNIPATTAIRFEPGEEKEVELVSFGGKQRIWGFNDLANGYAGGQDTPTYYPTKMRAFRKMEEYGFKDVSEDEADAEFTTKES
ncbi:MAG: urease subunit beta [Muribaculum sp.]|nr:urease subunit beta [Muribaculum sp.]MDE5704494.1 urease subunit beta [Muribaculum sp.]